MNWICRFREENLSFLIPKEFLIEKTDPFDGLFHGGIDSPSLNAIDPLRQQRVHITKYLSLKSKSTRSNSFVHLVEHINLTSRLSHENVRRVLSWYIADKCLYSITTHIQCNLRQAIQTQRFPIERIRLLSSQIIQGTIYLQCQGLSPLTPWYTTNIELTDHDRIRLCSPTIASKKLNGEILQHQHLWRHAPECLIRLILSDKIDSSREDVWSIGCIIVEMMIQTILFRPSNDDPSLQLFCIVRLIGGMTKDLYERFPVHIKQIFSSFKTDPNQRRLDHCLKQIFHQYQLLSIEHRFNSELYHLLSQMFQFQWQKRLTLTSTLEHPFFSIEPMKIMCRSFERKSFSSNNVEDLIRLTIQLNLEQSRWLLTLKERCLFEILLHLKDFSTDQFNLSRTLKNEIIQLKNFFL